MVKLKVIVLAASMLLVLVPAQPASAASCSRVAGGSQTSNWYTNGDFESRVVADEWERQSRGGQSIENWGLGGSGWATRIRYECIPTGTLPTRLVLQVLPSHQDRTVEGISGHIADALAAVAVELPSVTRITLIPPISGVGCDDVGLSASQPEAVAAINQHIGGTVDAGAAVIVPDCSMFSDLAGHLTQEGANFVAEQYSLLLPGPSGPPDEVPPVVAIVSPADGASVNGVVSVVADATDDVAISRVDLVVDGTVVSTDTTGPYEFSWDSPSVVNGPHVLTAVAFDTGGNITTSEPINVTTENDVEPPVDQQLSANPSVATVGEQIVFTDLHAGNHRRIFEFGDGTETSARGSSFSYTYTNPGSYVVTLQTLDIETGQRVTLSVVVTVSN